MAKKAATLDDMKDLHSTLAKKMKSILIDGEVVVDEDGNLKTQTPSVSALNAIRQFLKDNNVQADPATNADLKAITEELPFDEYDDSRH